MMNSTVPLILYIFILLSTSRATSGSIHFALDEPKSENADKMVDPHSFYYNKQTQQLYTESDLEVTGDNNNIESYEKCHKVFKNCLNRQLNDIPDETFSRRLINVLLSSANFEENDNFMTGSISIEISPSELKKLKNFGLGKATIRDIDYFIVSIFQSSKGNSITDIFKLIQTFLMYLLRHKEMMLVTAVVLYITWLLRTSRWNMSKMLQASVLMIFIASFIITYFQLLKNAEIKQTAKQLQFSELPIHCRPHLMKWWEKIWHKYDSPEDCQKYYEAREENHYLHVTPAVALSHMISTVLLYPADILGDTISKFVYQCTKSFWFPLQIIFVPLMTILSLVLIVIVVVCTAGGSFGWGIGPFKLFSLSGSSCTKKKKKLRSKGDKVRIEVILKEPSVEHVQQIAITPADKSNLNKNVCIKNQDQTENNSITRDNSEISNSNKVDDKISDVHTSDIFELKSNREDTSEKKHQKVEIFFEKSDG